jgi:nucleoid-associated protein YgaU
MTDTKKIALYDDARSYYVLVQMGSCCIDSDGYERVVRLDRKQVDEAFSLVRDLAQKKSKRAAESGGVSETAGSLRPGIYVVKKGDSFAKIARKLYGETDLWPLIQKANPEVEASRILPGEVLKISPERKVKGGEKQPSR